jgi:hypothetical protein
MSARNGSSDFTIGVVGDGFGALMVYSTAVYLGFDPDEIGVFGENANPVQTYQQFAWNLGQTVLRSESESHFLPADWPTFAQLEAFARLSPRPLLRSTRRKFNPGVAEMLAEAGVVARSTDFGSRLVGGVKVGWLVREPGPPAHFVLHDEDARPLGRCRHVVLAIGHGPLAFPGALGRARDDPATRERIVQAYEAKQYFPNGRYVVLGNGIAGVNEWANVIDAGATCIALRRNPEPDDQDLNVPRCLFDGSGIDSFQALTFDERLDFIGDVLRGTSPSRRAWAETVRRGRAEGRFEEVIGTIQDIRAAPGGLELDITLHRGDDVTIEATGVVAATGFTKSVFSLPLLRRLIDTYDVPVERERIVLASNCGVPQLDQPDSRLCMMGITANSVVPNGDTIAGLKYIARRFVADVARAEGLRERPVAGRIGMQVGLARRAIAAIRHIDPTAQLA